MFCNDMGHPTALAYGQTALTVPGGKGGGERAGGGAGGSGGDGDSLHSSNLSGQQSLKKEHL